MKSASENARMTAQERRACVALAAIFALRMLGLFLVLPVFALEARKYPGGDDAAQVGLALGLYGLTQALLQLPLGLASDRFGRKRVIVCGMLVFAAGSVLAALAQSLTLLMWGRALQGAGAVSAASMALLADVTRDAVRTKAMAIVGASIGASFALALVLAPPLSALGGLPGIFALTALMALMGIGLLLWAVPTPVAVLPSVVAAPRSSGSWRELLRHGELLRLNAGAFALHLVQTAMWVGVPVMLVRAGLEKPQHWRVYLSSVLLSFALLALLFALERRGHLRKALLGAIALVAAAQMGLAWLALPGQAVLWPLAFFLWVFFCGFNMLEASQPSLVSRMAPPHLRGAAMGAYGTLQSLGLFAGGALGGALAQRAGLPALFAATFVLSCAWLCVAWPLRPVGRGH